MADASIFQQYLQPVKSVADYGADMDRQQLNALQLVGQRRANDTAELQMQQTRGQIADAAAKRNALQSLYSNPAITTPKAREDAMLSNPLLMQDGMAAQEARLKAAHLEAQTANQGALAVKNVAEAGAADYKLRIDKAAKALKDIAGFQSPAEALADLQRNAQAGNVPPEQAQIIAQQLQGITDPQGFATWQQNMRYRILDAKDQLEQDWKGKAEERAKLNDASANNNRDLVPDGRGGWKVNQPLVDAKTRIAAAGAANSVTMGTPLAATVNGEQVFVQPANRPGAAPTILRVPGANGGTVAPPPKDAKPMPVEFTKSVAGLNELENGLKSYEATLKQEGGPNALALKEQRAALQGSFTSLQMGLKNAFELGALAGPDLNLLNSMLSDPTGVKANALGMGGALEQISKAREYLANRRKAVYDAHGIPQPQPGATAVPLRGGPMAKPTPKTGSGPSVSNW